jgi:histidyl-tRNA synthetase
MGDVVIGELLRARGLMPAVTPSLQFWVAQTPDSPDAPRAALETASAMRHAGCAVEYALRSQKLDKQLEAGRKAGAATFVIVDAANSDAPWRVRRTGHDDQTFSTLEALCAWASQQNGTVR